MKRILSVFLFLLLLPVCSAVRAEESSPYGYVARLTPDGASDIPAFITIGDKSTAEQYLREGIISYYEINYPVSLPEEIVTGPEQTGVSLFSTGYWQHTAINLPAPSGGGSGIRVGILDSGVNPHADFGSRLLTGYNVLTETTDTSDNIGHGTRVAGMVASTSIGIAPGAEIYPVKCFDAGKDTYVIDILNAMQNAIDNGCDILNMSLGFTGFGSDTQLYQSFTDLISHADRNDILIVTAVGNDANKGNPTYYPAGLSGVIGVGAVSQSSSAASGYTRASYSEYNDTVDIVAPGNCVGAPDKDGDSDYVTTSDTQHVNGTSFACPMIAGILALGLSTRPDKDPHIVADALLLSARDLGDSGWDAEYGFGLADVTAFLAELERTDRTHVSRTAMYTNPDGTVQDGLVVYNAGETPFTLHGASYCTKGTPELTGLLTVTASHGYTLVLVTNMTVFIWNKMLPAAAPRKIETPAVTGSGMAVFCSTPIQ
ncbi:MAG: S8 family serine peptidase [Clostridia bacterium]|nr:S8 family serine peptidase [Clostridia bacterium]